MAELLGADLHARQLERRCYQGLRALAAAEGWSLEARAYEPHTLTLPRPVEGLRWVPTSDEGPGPLITRFEALELRARQWPLPPFGRWSRDRRPLGYPCTCFSGANG